MNFGVIRERVPQDRRVAMTPAVVRRLVEAGHTVWVESGAGLGAMFPDAEYVAAGAQLAYSPAQVLQRSDVAAKISSPTPAELELCRPGLVLLAFYHLAVAERRVWNLLQEREITAVGLEIVETEDGAHPVLAPVSEIAGRATISIAAHLLRSSSGGRGILLGGTRGVPPAHVVILGAGAVGCAAAHAAAAAGARVTALDIDPLRLQRLDGMATALARTDAVLAAVVAADVVIGAVLIAGARTPHVVTRAMVEAMKPGAAILDVSIDQGGCVETSRPTTLADPTFSYRGVIHYCVPNLTADLGHSTSVAVAEAVAPYLLDLGARGLEHPDLLRGLYTRQGRQLAEARHA